MATKKKSEKTVEISKSVAFKDLADMSAEDLVKKSVEIRK